MVSKGIWLWFVALTICVGLSSFACASGLDDAPHEAVPSPIVELKLSSTSMNLVKGSSVRIVATAIDASGKTQTPARVTWETSDCGVVIVDASGILTASGLGVATIRAQLDGATASARVYVKAQPFELAIKPFDTSVEVKHKRDFIATRTEHDGSTSDVTRVVRWVSSNEKIATIDEAGHAHGLEVGTTTIRALVEGVSAETTFTVTAVQIVSIAITPGKASVSAADAFTFTLTATFSDGSKGDVGGSKLSWMSADEKIATIDVGGTAIARGVGKVQIMAIVGGGITTVAELTVTPAKLARIEITPTDPSGVAGGAKVALRATAIYGDGRTVDITEVAKWTSAGPTIAEVDAFGGVTPRTPGVVEITAEYEGLESRVTFTSS